MSHASSSPVSDTVKRIEVAIGVLLERRQGQWFVLIARRQKQAVFGGYWELPGGKVEPDETLHQCLAREFMEELGVQIAVGEALPTIDHDYAHGQVRLNPFFCSRTSGEPQNLHVAEHRWVTADQLAQYQFPPANDDLMQQLRDRLCKLT